MSHEPIRLILASESKQRKMLMDGLKIPYEIFPADLDEKKASKHIDPKDFARKVMTIAKAKGDKVVQQNLGCAVVAADTIVVVDDQVLEKPATLSEAKFMLEQESGKKVETYTGVFLFSPAQANSPHKTQLLSSYSWLKMRDFTAQDIESYTTNNPVTTWAGGFSPAYPEGANLIAEIHGSLTGCCYGFPMEIILPWINSVLYLK